MNRIYKPPRASALALTQELKAARHAARVTEQTRFRGALRSSVLDVEEPELEDLQTMARRIMSQIVDLTPRKQ